MTINFKSEEFKQIWDIATQTSKMNNSEYEKFTQKSSKEDITKSLMGGYAIDLVSIAETSGIELDMTYDTVDILDEAIKAFFEYMHYECYAEEAIAHIIARSMASYFTLLAINEENCPCEYNDKYSSLMTEEALSEILDVTFSGVAVVLAGKQKSELLPAALRCIRTKDNNYSDLYINVVPLVRAYEKATDVHLPDYGFMNFLLKDPHYFA